MGCKFPMIRNRLTGKVIGYKQRVDNTHQKRYIDTFKNKNGKTIKQIRIVNDTHKVTINDLLNSSEWQLIPCGECTECRINHTREWAARCVCESMTHEHNWFLTLTYDEEHVPGINRETGEIFHGFGMYEVHDGEFKQVMTLEPDDFTTFKESLNKKLRRAGKEPIRYYMCGEYGSTTFRPHYHVIAFNLELQESEMEFMFVNKEHQPIYKCQWLEDLWGKGIVRIGAVTWNSAAYVARYIMKKQNGKLGEERKRKIGNIPEYTRQSKFPAIGTDYALMNREQIEKFNKLILPGEKAKIMHTPKYFEKLYDDLFEQENGDIALNKRKSKRADEKFKKAQMQMRIKKQKSTLDWWEQLRVEHEAAAEKYKKLIRPLE